MSGNNVRFGAYMDDQVSSTLGKIKGNFDQIKQSQGFAAAVQGVGIGAGIAAWGMLAHGVATAKEKLGEVVHAGEANEAITARLTASIYANTKGWDGNLSKIDEVLQSRRQLGFTDLEQKDALAGLVGATHDVNKALDIERVAMDLARYKHISLGDAVLALTKVEAGSYKILKSLGIELQAGATQTEALAAVQAIASGQAEAYGKSTEGAVDRMHAAFDALKEKIGAQLLPVVTKLADAGGWLADNFSALTPVIVGLGFAIQTGLLPGLIAGIGALGGFAIAAIPVIIALAPIIIALAALAVGLVVLHAALENMHVTLATFGIGVSHTRDELVEMAKHSYGARAALAALDEKTAASADAWEGAANRIVTDVEHMRGGIASNFVSVKADLASTVASWQEAQQKLAHIDGQILASNTTLIGKLKSLAAAAISGYYDPLIEHDKLMADEARLAAAQKILASSKSTAAQKADAIAVIHETQKATTEERINLLEAGKLSKKEQEKLLADLKYDWAHSTGAAKLEIGQLIAEIERLKSQSRVNINVNVNGRVGGVGGLGGKAGGGFAPPGETIRVGEQGEELAYAVPGGGMQIASASTRRTGGGGGGGIHIHLHSVWPATKQQIKAIYDELARYEYSQPVSGSGNRF